MNREELLALVEALSPGWMRFGRRRGRYGRSERLHAELLDIVTSAGTSKQQASTMRRALVSAINTTSLTLIGDAETAIESLHDAQLRIGLEDPAHGQPSAQLMASEVPPFKHARLVIRFASAVRALPPASQIWIARWLDLEALRQRLQTDASNAAAMGDPGQRIEAAQALAAHKRTIGTYRNSAPTAAREFLDVYRFMVGQFAWGAWGLPLQASATSTNRELAEIADWYERLRSAMYRPLPMDEAAPASSIRRWRKGWRDFEECGETFGLVADWLRAMASSGHARRCLVCYRHLGPGMKRFCARHQRTANARQDARELHIADIYGPVVKRRTTKHPPINAMGSPSEKEVRRMAEQAKAVGICDELAWPAGGLASSLRALYPLMTPPAREQLQNVFVRMFSIAQEPFEQEGVLTYEEQLRRTKQRREAPRLLTPASFFRALYSAPYAVEWAKDRTLGAGLDVDHPFAHHETVLPSRLALDLIHLSTWLEVDSLFDQFAYLNPLDVKRLKKGQPLTGTPPMSLAQVARVLGVSAEAVRQTLRHSDGHASMNERRQRVIPARLAELRANLMNARDT